MKRLTIGVSALLLLAVAVGLGVGEPALSIPSSVPHGHRDSTDVKWWLESGNEAKAHNHRSNRNFNNNNLYNVSSVWDDRVLHIGTTVQHGFIQTDDSKRPRYCIDSGVPAQAKLRIEDAFNNKWGSIAADQGLRLGLSFKEVDPCPPGCATYPCPSGFVEIRVGWERNQSDLGYTQKQVPEFSDCRFDDGLYSPCLVAVHFNHDVTWNFDVNPGGVANNAYHFFTTALHEVGHVVGLGDQTDSDDVMISRRDLGCPQHTGAPTGDVRLTAVGSYPAGSVVDVMDSDVYTSLIGFAASEKHTDNGNGQFDPGEYMYRDMDASGKVSKDDVRLTAVGSYPAGSTVGESDSDVGNDLIAFATNEKHTDGGSAQFDPGEYLYRDVDSSNDVSWGAGPCFDSLDTDSNEGARDLYSIPPIVCGNSAVEPPAEQCDPPQPSSPQCPQGQTCSSTCVCVVAPTPTPGGGAVGGIAVLPEIAQTPERTEPVTSHTLLAGIAVAGAAGVIVLGAGFWFAQRRRLT